ncbi:MAG: hypothetical protein R3263_10225, partial [Myxococcota bacterium]|nr:hypothetical protein [Myxococcota bacterium]
PGPAGEPVVGYRVELGGRSVVISGAAAGSRALRATAAGAELLVHEAQAAHLVEARADARAAEGRPRAAQLLGYALGGRAPPAQAVALAREIGARQLVLTHLSPPLSDPASVRAFLRGSVQGWSGEVRIGEDGLHFAMPAQVQALQVDRLEEVEEP